MSPSECQSTFRVRLLDVGPGRPTWRRRYLQREVLPSFAAALREARAFLSMEFPMYCHRWFRITERRSTPGRRVVCYSRDVLLTNPDFFEIPTPDVILNRKRERECSNVG